LPAAIAASLGSSHGAMMRWSPAGVKCSPSLRIRMPSTFQCERAARTGEPLQVEDGDLGGMPGLFRG